jgi:hypothetical protein
VRLTALPYEPIVKEQPKIEPAPEKKPEEKKPAEEKKPEEKPAEKSAEPTAQEEKKEGEKPAEPQPEKPEAPKNPIPQIKMPGQKPNFGKGGEIRDAKLNATIARELAGRWRTANRPAEDTANTRGLILFSKIFRGEEAVGKQMLQIGEGSLVATYEIDGKKSKVRFSEQKYWIETPDKPTQEVAAAKAHRDPHFAQAVLLAGLLREDIWGEAGKLALQGSDKAAGRLCYRLALTDATSEELFVWLSVVNEHLQPEIQLVKSGVGYDDDETIASTIYRQWKPIAGYQLPMERTLVRKLAEEEVLRIVTTNAQALDKNTPEGLQTVPKVQP